MNINEYDLNSEENKKKIAGVISQLKNQITIAEQKCIDEEKRRKEFEEKCYNINQQKLIIDQKLAKTEQALRNKSQELFEKEETIIQLQRQLDSLQNSKKGFFGFKDDECKQLRKKLLNLESEFQITTSELLRLHEELFDKKKRLEDQENLKLQIVANLETEIQKLQDIINTEKQHKQQLEKQIQDNLLLIQQKDNELKDCKQKLNEKDDEIRILQDQAQQQQIQYNEIQNTLILKKEELKKTYQEADQMKLSLSQIKEFMFNIIPHLETELQNSQQLQNLKQFIDKIFGVDKQRELKIIQIKQEQELQKEFLVVKDGYQVFQKAKDRILRMGKNIEQLEKKNKQLQDKIFILENKRIQNKSDYLSDKISVI